MEGLFPGRRGAGSGKEGDNDARRGGAVRAAPFPINMPNGDDPRGPQVFAPRDAA